MSLKSHFIVLIALLSFRSVQSQVLEIKPDSDLANQPEWVQLMYQEQADPDEVAEAYEAYYKTHDFVKNIHTQYYKRWQRAMQEDATGWFASGGKIAPSRIRALEADYLDRTKALRLERGPSSAWECIGPFDFDKESVSRSYAAGAAHVYTVEQSISNPNILYAGTATGGVFKSVDKGLHWTLVTKDMMINGSSAIEIDYTNPDIAFFGSGGSLYKTIDGGVTWNPAGSPSFQAETHYINDIVMQPNNNQVIYLCASDGLFKTTDAGSNFTKIVNGTFQELEFKPGDVNTIYAVRQIGNHTEFYKSTDGGVTWVLSISGWPGVISFSQTPSFVAGGLGGANTDYIKFASNPNLGNATTPNFTIEMNIKVDSWQGDPAILSNKDWASGFNKGFVIVANTNGTWGFNIGNGTDRIDIGGGDIDDGVWHHIAVTYDATGMKRTYQDGVKVDSSNTQIGNNVGTLLDLALGQDGTLSYGSAIGLQVSEIRIWSSVLSAVTLNDWRCSALDNTHPNHANLIHHWKVDENAGTLVHDSAGNNNGTFMGNHSWTSNHVMNCIESSLDINEDQKRVEIAISADAPNNVYALATGKANGGSGLYGVYKSTNSGDSWTFTCCGPQPAGFPSASNPNLMGWSDQGLDNGGQYYYDLAFEVDPNDADKIHVGGVNHWVSTDGGVSFTCPAKWSHVDKVNYVHADIHDIRHYGSDLWFACDGGIFYSNDGGATINRRQFGIAGSDFWGFGLGKTDPEVMLGGTYHNGTLLKDHNVYHNGWLCTGGGDNVRGFVNDGDPRVVYYDSGRKRLSGDRLQAFQSLPLNLQPNASYTVGKSSNIEFFPENTNSFYLGNDTKIWKTLDGGETFTEVHDFGSQVGEIRVSGADSDVIYCTTFSPSSNIWKSTDAGATWSSITPAGSYRRYDIAVSNSNANEIWASRFGTTGANRVYHSTTGGASWTNITGSGMPGEKISNIVCQQGTDGGVYVGTKRAVYYRNNSMSDWVLFNNNLPASTYSTKLIPNYEIGKLYNGSNRGVYRVDFYEASNPVAQIAADKTTLYCTGEQVQFSSNSTASANATYNWSFPGGTPSSSTAKNPLVTYNTSGNYMVSLSVTDGGVTNTQTKQDFITVGDNCAPETVPGNALSLVDGINDYVKTPAMNLNTNTVTFTAWLKRSGNQNSYAGIMFCRGGTTTAGLNFKNNNNLGYHWNGGNYSWNSGHVVPDGEWTHVALVIEPTKATIYMNGIPAVHAANHPAEAFDAGLLIGGEPNNNRKFKGLMDEVCVFDKALSQQEIRELMHLTKPMGTPNLIHYYQFNEASGIAADRAGGGAHASFFGNAGRTTSTGPFGGGNSQTRTVTTGGSYYYNRTNVTLAFPNSGTYPDGDVVVSRINLQPDQTPGNNPIPNDVYWIFNNYGTNNSFSELTSLKFDNISPIITTNNGSEYKLHKRASNADGNTWGGELDYADEATSSSLTFSNGNGVTSFSQFAINKTTAVLPIHLLSFNVSPKGTAALIEWETAVEIDNKMFTLEKSKDGVIFSPLSDITPKGSSESGATYTYVDPSPYRGITYYRLKQIGFTGAVDYSSVKQITINALANEVVVYPNPVGNSRMLKVETTLQADFELYIFNAAGKLVAKTDVKSGKGQVGLENLPAGSYYYQFRNDHYLKNGKLVIE